MTSDAKKYELSNYRIKQAEESIEEAEFLLSGGKSPRSIINRAFELRQRGDYREYVELTREQATHFIGEARIFVSTVKDYLASRRNPETR